MKSLNTHMMGNFFGHFMLLLIYRFVKVKVNTFENLDEILKEYNILKTPKFTNSTQDLEDKLQAANEAISTLNAQITTLQTQNQLLNSKLLSKGSVSKSTTEMLLDNTHKFNYHNENALPINLTNDWDSKVSLATKIKLNYNPHATKVRDQIKTAALKNVLNQTSIKLKDCYVEHETNKIVYIMRDQVKPKEKISFTKKAKVHSTSVTTTTNIKNSDSNIESDNYYKSLNDESIEWGLSVINQESNTSISACKKRQQLYQTHSFLHTLTTNYLNLGEYKSTTIINENLNSVVREYSFGEDTVCFTVLNGNINFHHTHASTQDFVQFAKKIHDNLLSILNALLAFVNDDTALCLTDFLKKFFVPNDTQTEIKKEENNA